MMNVQALVLLDSDFGLPLTCLAGVALLMSVIRSVSRKTAWRASSCISGVRRPTDGEPAVLDSGPDMPGRIPPSLVGVRGAHVRELARRVLIPKGRRIRVRVPKEEDRVLEVIRRGTGPIRRQDGRHLWMQHFYVTDDGNYFAVMNVDLGPGLDPLWDPNRPVALRLDSGCVPGGLFGDVACDCARQVERALDYIAGDGRQGVLLHIPGHDGRGHGTPAHLSTLLSQQGLECDTVEAARLILPKGVPLDCREYDGAIGVLHYLGVLPGFRIESLSNNPAKRSSLEAAGFTVDRKPLVIPPTPFTARHYAAKERVLGHEGLIA